MKTSARRGVAIAIAALVVLAFAPSALAQAPIRGYGGQAGDVAGQVGGGAGGGGVGNETAAGGAGPAASEAAASDGGVLAFTGLDLGLIAGGGLLLIVTGVALSRIVVRNPAA